MTGAKVRETVPGAVPAATGPSAPRKAPRLPFRPPIEQRRFWDVQALIVVVTAVHIVFEYNEPSLLGSAYFVPATLYLFPVLYASLNFGLQGAIPTALWSGALSAPDVIWNHEGTARLGEIFQVGVILVLSTLVAVRVDKERAARRASEESERERSISENKYRSLFENSGVAILIVDREGLVREANTAAARLGVDLAGRGPALAEQLPQGAAAIQRALAGNADAGDFCVNRADGIEVWLQPICTTVRADHGELTQVLLRDVTERHGFQHYAQEIVRAQEDERQRIAQELHDVSVQSAILICRRLDAASQSVESHDPEAVTRTIAEARRAAEEMADELRRFSRDLRPLILEDLGFVPALRRLVGELRERSHVRLRFEVHGEARRLEPGAELVLFRIGQEALRNAEHHASATHVSLRLSFGPETVRLEIIDNGVGFKVPPLTALVDAGSLGLLGMQERARLVGGNCLIHSKPGQGTHVTAEIPIKASNPRRG